MTRETTILWTEITDFPKGWGIKKHAHKDYYHLFYFVKGQGVFLIGSKKFDIVPGSCFLLPPGTIHGLEDPTADGLRSYEIKFTIQDPYLREHLVPEETILTVDGNFIKTSVEYVLKYGLSHNPDKLKRANYFMCALLTYFVDSHTEPEIKNSELIDTTNYSATTISILTYIEANYMNHIYLDDIAEHVEYNRNYMCSIFKNDTGITIVDYLNFVRIRKACEYILYSDIELSQICYRVGFPNLSHFHRTFKKFVGTTPTTYSKIENMDDNHLFAADSPSESGSHSHFPPLEKALAAIKVSP